MRGIWGRAADRQATRADSISQDTFADLETSISIRDCHADEHEAIAQNADPVPQGERPGLSFC